MMQFYKKRDFGTFISDTFNFFKIYGRNYFKNYILLNGILLIGLVVVFFFGYREFFMQLFGTNAGGESYYFESYFENNIGVLVMVILLLFVLFSALMIITYLFPVFYLKRISEGQNNVKSDEILSDLKTNFKKILMFYLATVFLFTPLFLAVFLIGYVLIIILIGIFVLLLVVPAMMNGMMFTSFDYFNTNRGFFESLSYGFRAQFSYPSSVEKSPFWKYWGSSVIMYFIVNMIGGLFTAVPIIVFYIYILTAIPNGNFQGDSPTSVLGVFFFIIYGVSILFSFFFNNLIYINAGLMYYDSRTDLHRNIDILEIDSIGTNEED